MRFYSPEISRVMNACGDRLMPSPRFADLELIETSDPCVFFDRRRTDRPVDAASPVQVWLELRAGDKRQNDTAEAVRARIMEELKAAGWAAA